VKADEYADIRGELFPPSFRDPALIPECFALAFDALGRIARTGDECICPAGLNVPRDPACPVLHVNPQWYAEQALRRMVQRARTGVPVNEPEDIRG
jgi:hypothetical protein